MLRTDTARFPDRQPDTATFPTTLPVDYFSTITATASTASAPNPNVGPPTPPAPSPPAPCSPPTPPEYSTQVDSQEADAEKRLDITMDRVALTMDVVQKTIEAQSKLMAQFQNNLEAQSRVVKGLMTLAEMQIPKGRPPWQRSRSRSPRTTAGGAACACPDCLSLLAESTEPAPAPHVAIADHHADTADTVILTQTSASAADIQDFEQADSNPENTEPVEIVVGSLPDLI